MLEAENLVKQFEKNEKKHKKVLFSAVDHVSLHIKEGEIVGVLGLSLIHISEPTRPY